MKTSHWKTLMLAGAASLLALGCTKDAESKQLAPAAVPQQAAETAPSTPQIPGTTAAGTAPVAEKAAPRAELAAIAPTTGAAKAVPEQPVRSFRGASAKAVPQSGGQVIAKKTYVVTISAPTATSGSEASITLTLVPKSGRKINMEFPTKLTVVAPEGVSLVKAKLRKADAATFTEKKAIFHVKYKASAAGAKNFTGKFKFAVCTEATCDPMTEKLAFQVSVK